jgi:hypothetical protein
MLAVLAALSSCYEALYSKISVSDFNSKIWEDAANTSASNVLVNDYVDASRNGCFVVRDPGENIPYNSSYLYYHVVGTPKEIAEAKMLANATSGWKWTKLDHPDSHRCGNISIVRFDSEASYIQLSTFWISLIPSLLVVGAMLTAFLLWHFDPYAKDPVNSLLFVTDGNRIVTGE